MAKVRFVDLAGLIEIEKYLEASPDITRRAASMALNDVIGGPQGIGRYRKGISQQINFPAGYVNDDRLGVDQKATPTRLVTSILARQRPTSLARFATSGVVGGKGGVTVKVKPGGAGKTFKSGFLVRLRNGVANDGTNLGLAVRLQPGQTLNKKDTSRMVHLESNVVLLYGPSIDQVLNTSVAEAETPQVLDSVATEFFRQFARLSDG